MDRPADFTARLSADHGLLGRLLLGALSEHEQRLLATRVVELDSTARDSLRAAVAPLAAASGTLEELAAACDEAAADGDDDALAGARARLLGAARAEADLDEVVRDYTYDDALRLSRSARRLFSWGLAEHLLARAADDSIGDREARTALYLATAVVDVLDLFGAAAAASRRPAYAAALRRHIDAVRADLG